MRSMHDKGVLVEAAKNNVPNKHRAIKTVWQFQVKRDSGRRITRFCQRLSALGDNQTPSVYYRPYNNVDFHEIYNISYFVDTADSNLWMSLEKALLLRKT